MRPQLESLEDRTTPTAGELDPTFGTGGRAFPDLGSFGQIAGVATQPDGKILVAGVTNGFLAGDLAVARLTPAGQLDPTFGTGGVYTLDLGGRETAAGLFPRPDGSVLVSGYSDTPGGAVVLVRLTATGQPDPTFGTGGRTRIGFGGTFESGGIAGVLGDGRIVLGGSSDFDFAAARLTSAGQLDPTFGVGGRVVDTAGPVRDTRGFALQSDGKLVVVGNTQEGPTPFVAAARFTTGGQLDSTFGTAGRVTADFGTFDVPTGVALQADGKLVLAGFTDDFSVRNFAALRLTATGQLDPTFGTGGLAVVDFGYQDTTAGVVVQPNGAIVLAGFVNTAPVYSNAAARLTSTGQLDPTFGTGGRVVHPYSAFDQAAAVGLQPNGKVLVAGSYQQAGVGTFPMVIRLTTDPAPNAAPQISDVADQTVQPGGTTGALSFTVSDAETPAANLTVTAASSNPTLVPLSGIFLGGAGASRTVTVTPATGQAGTATVTLTVTDAGGLTTTDTFTVTVPPPPPPPPPLPAANVSFSGDGVSTPSNAMSVASGDFNGDGKPDAVVGSSGGVTVFLNDGPGGVGTGTTMGTGSSFPRSVRVADLTGDGKLDVIAGNDIGQSISVLRGNGDGTFQPAVVVAVGGANLQGFVAADLDGDTDLDVVVVEDDRLAVLLNVGGTAILGAPTFFGVGTGGRGIDAAHLDADGKLDLVVADNNHDRLLVFPGAGGGTFGAVVPLPTGAGSQPAAVIARTAAGLPLDFNGDGKTDLAAGYDGNGLVGVLLGDGAGRFSAPNTFTSGFPRAGRLAAADFDADGNLDLVAQVSVGGSPTSQPVFVGDGAGGFSGVAQVSIVGDTDVTAADLNADGRPDLLGTIGFSPGILVAKFNTTPVVAAFQVSAPAAVRAGVPFAVTVTAKGAGGATFTGYKGVVRFTSSDGSAVLPLEVRFAPVDNGVKTVVVTLNAAGVQSFTVGDRVLTGVSATTAVAVNHPPTATPDTFTIAEDTAATTVPVLTNDSFAPDTGETLTVVSVTQPLRGAVTLTGGVVSYAPTANYAGADSFTYTVSDGNGGTAAATVTVTVTPINDLPTANPDTLTVAEDDPATAVAVLGNDSSAPDGGETLSVSAVGQPAHGVVTLVGGVVRYAPAANYFGPDAFTYTLSDGNGGTATGTVTVTVTPVNDPPAPHPDTLVVAEDAAATVVDVLDNDSSGPETGETLVVVSVTQPAHGTVTLVGGVVRYTPTANYTGADFFTYTVSDGNGEASIGSVAVTVTPVNDPPTAAPDAFTVDPGAPSTLAVLANDSSAPDTGETLAVTAVTQPAAGGTVALIPSGAVVFTPAAGFVGDATFTYTVGDGTPGSTATATVTVTVQPGGLGPVRPVVIGGGTDGSVRIVAPDGSVSSASPFGNTGAPTRTASADLNNDGVADVVAVTGPGTALRVAVLNGADGSVLVAPFDPFGGDFPGGGYVAAADLDGDGRAEFVVTPDEGGGPRVTIFAIGADGTRTTRANFFGIDDSNFRGGARAALGDVNGDGTPDVIVAAGFGGGPRTAIFTGQSVLAGNPTRLVADFFAFPGADATNLRNGSFVAAGDITGDGFADLVFGGGPGGAPRIFILSGALVSAGNAAGAQSSPVANFFVGGDLSDRGGARVGVTNRDGDEKADLVVGSGAGRPAKVKVYLGKDFVGAGEPVATDLDPLGGAVLADGIYVG